MSGPIIDPIPGLAAFVGIKLAGYTLAAVVVSNAYRRSNLNPWLVGGTRTVLGLFLGLPTIFAGSVFANELNVGGGAPAEWIGLLFLLPVRLAEWWILIWLFYDRSLSKRSLGWKVASLGTLWSFLLDVVGIAGAFASDVLT